MALSKDEIKTAYPLPVYNYRVEIDGEAVSFSEVSGLSISYETTTYKESPTESGSAGPRVMHMPAQGTAANVTLKKGMVTGASVPMLYGWINSTQTNQIDKKDIFIRLCDEAGAPLVSWKVLGAFPTKLDAPTFGADSNDVAVESMELMANSITIEET
jgi:phage tail-like protein